MTYQRVTGTLSPGAHAGSYNGQDAYNDMLVVDDELCTSGIRTVPTDGSSECAETKRLQRFNRLNPNMGGSETAKTSVVRRLSTVECTRLQGFPDDWLNIGDWVDSNGKTHRDTSSAKYKAIGNSIALPFWQWLLKRISAQYERPATMGSLFSGIGGFDLCWTRCNGIGTVLWESEIEEFPIAVCKQHFGDEDAGTVGDIEKYL